MSIYLDNTKTNPDSHLANYTPNDPACPICKKAVEPQHTPARDQVTGTIGHDYCLRIEAFYDRSKRMRSSIRPILQAGKEQL
jgi:hypothetical protein